MATRYLIGHLCPKLAEIVAGCSNRHYLDVRVPWLQVDLAFSNPRVFVAEFTFFIAEYAFFMQGTTIITT